MLAGQKKIDGFESSSLFQCHSERFLWKDAYASEPPARVASNPDVMMNPPSSVKNKKEPKRDILILSSFDFISRIIKSTTVAFRPAIWALEKRHGPGNSGTVRQQLHSFWPTHPDSRDRTRQKMLPGVGAGERVIQ